MTTVLKLTLFSSNSCFPYWELFLWNGGACRLGQNEMMEEIWAQIWIQHPKSPWVLKDRARMKKYY